MSEESKIDSDYVTMFDGAPAPAATPVIASVPGGLDDPNLSQEEKDLRLAIALQQEENSAALSEAQGRKAAQAKSNTLRTGRSGAHTKLVSARTKQQTVPSSFGTADAGQYAAPPSVGGQEARDYQLAVELQKVEATSVDTSTLSRELTDKEKSEKAAAANRAARSGNMRGFA